MKPLWIIVLLTINFSLNAQPPLTLQQALEVALKNNEGIKAATDQVESQRQLKKTSFDLPKTNVSLMYGQYNSYSKKDNNLTVTQSIPFTAFGSQRALNRSLLVAEESRKAVTVNELTFQVKQVFYGLGYLEDRQALLLQQDSLYEGFLKAAAARYRTGEANLLEQATAETQRNEITNQLVKNKADQVILQTVLKTLLNSDVLPSLEVPAEAELTFGGTSDSTDVQGNPSMAFMQQQVDVASSQKKVEAARAAPEVLVGFFSQTLIGVQDTEYGTGEVARANDRFTGFQVGLSIPLWYAPHQGRIKSAEYNRQAAAHSYQYAKKRLQNEYEQAYQGYLKNRTSLSYYKEAALPNAELIIKQSQAAFQNGEIGYAEYLLGLQRAIAVKEGYISTLNDYNQSIIYLEFLSGNKQ